MPVYEFSVKDRSGKDTQGVRDVESHEALVTQLRAEGFLILSIRELK